MMMKHTACGCGWLSLGWRGCLQPLSEKSVRISLPKGPEHTPQSAVHHIPFPLVGGGLLPLLCQPALEADFARAMGHRAVACNTGNGTPECGEEGGSSGQRELLLR